MTNQFLDISSIVASVLVGQTGNKTKKEESSFEPAFDLDAIVAPTVHHGKDVCSIPSCPRLKKRIGSILTKPVSNFCEEHTEEFKNKQNEKVEIDMNKENTVVQEAVVVEEKKGFFANIKKHVADITGKAKATVEAATTGATTAAKGASAEGFVAKTKAFVSGFASGFTSTVVDGFKKHGVKSLVGLGILSVAGLFTSGMTAAALVAIPAYAAGSFAVSYAVSKYKGADFAASKSALVAVMESVGYGFFGAVLAHFLLGLGIALLANLCIYGYVAYSYMTYFIVA